MAPVNANERSRQNLDIQDDFGALEPGFNMDSARCLENENNMLLQSYVNLTPKLHQQQRRPPPMRKPIPTSAKPGITATLVRQVFSARQQSNIAQFNGGNHSCNANRSRGVETLSYHPIGSSIAAQIGSGRTHHAPAETLSSSRRPPDRVASITNTTFPMQATLVTTAGHTNLKANTTRNNNNAFRLIKTWEMQPPE